MGDYTSQEEAIYAQATACGVSHDVIYHYFDEMIDHVTDKYPAKSANWRLEKAEQDVWKKFFPDEPFPGNLDVSAIAESNSAIVSSLVKAHHNSHESLQHIEPLGERAVNIKVEPQSSPIRRSFTQTGTFSNNTSGYASQAKLIMSKAVGLGLQLNGFQEISKEKHKIAETRFPGESPGWQAWLAESLVWSFYFKETPFLGLEPVRLYPLRSSMDVAPKRPGSSSAGDKWAKFSDAGLGLSPKKVITGANMIDSYRPSDSAVVRTTTDRAIPLAIDSYRPERTSPPKPIPTIPLSRSSGMSDSNLEHSSSKNNSTLNSPAITGYLASSGRSSSVSNPTTTITNTYMPLEKAMERKAIALGKRREFFQYLQKKRDQVRGEHPNCSSEYRHYAADTLVWARFFNRDPFPSAAPRGSGLHALGCSMYASQTYSQTLRPIERIPPPLQFTTNKSLTSSERLSASPYPPSNNYLASSERLSVPYKPRSNKSLTTSERSSIPQSKLQPETSLSPRERSSQPPRELILELSSKRLTTQLVISKETRALMVNKRITWTTATCVKRIAESFSAIDVSMLDLVENELKCHFRLYEMSSTGDIILWNEAFLTDDKASSDRGGKFLDGWFDFTFRTEKIPFSTFWKQFSNSEKMDVDSTNSAGSSMILVNGKFFKCSFAKSQEVCRLFYLDKPGLHGLPLDCQFTYSFRTPDQKTVELRAYITRTWSCSNRTSDSISAKDKETSKRGNDFLESWVRDSLSSGKSGVIPSEHFNKYINSRSSDVFSARLIIRGAAKITLPCPAPSIAQIFGAIANLPFLNKLREIRKDLKFDIQCRQRREEEDADGIEALIFQISPSDGGDTDAVERGTILVTSWAMKASKDPGYSLLAHLQKSSSVPSTPVNDPKPPNPQASENDWEKYASTFKSSELDRLMIEEAAKVEGSLRMVLDEASGQVVGLEEFARRIRAEDNRSPKVGDSRTVVDLTSENGSPEVKNAGERVSKRKLEDDDAEQVEKKSRL